MAEMKSIFIEDYELQLFTKLVNEPNIKIIGIHVKFQYEKDKIISTNPDIPVYLTEDIIRWSETFVSKEEITTHRDSQIKVSHFFDRILDCSASERQAYYYSSLAFWNNIFENSKIDCVLIGQVDHGSPADTVLIDIATGRNIPTYICEIILYDNNNHNAYYAIKCCNSNTYINIKEISDKSLSITEINKFIESVMNTNQKSLDNDYAPASSAGFPDLKRRTEKEKERIMFILNTIEFIPRKFSKITHRKYNSHIEASKLLTKLEPPYFYLRYWITYILKQNSNTEIQGHKVYFSSKKNIQGWHYTKSLIKYYQKHAIRDIPQDEKYVLYALHLEPEAAIMARTIYNSQLYNISMIAHSLPDGWKLYVKEHPHQFKLIGGCAMYTAHMSSFRTKSYYDEICSLPNTYLLDYRIPSSKLVHPDNSQENRINAKPQAISTINGSITLESILHGIPTLLFDKSTIPYESPLILGISNQEDIIHHLKNIANNNIPIANLQILITTLSERLFTCTPDENFQISTETIVSIIKNKPGTPKNI